METRKHKVVDTRDNSVKEFESTATTLGELKQELLSLGITTDGMSIQEGYTRTELVDDASILPHDVNYHGITTNNLVFRLTRTNKKTELGADRKMLYTFIKENDLADAVKTVFGKNFTQVSSADLEKFVADHSIKVTQSAITQVTPDVKGDNNILKAIAILADRFQSIGEEDIFDELEENTGIDFYCYLSHLREPQDSDKKKETKEYSELNDLFAGM